MSTYESLIIDGMKEKCKREKKELIGEFLEDLDSLTMWTEEERLDDPDAMVFSWNEYYNFRKKWEARLK